MTNTKTFIILSIMFIILIITFFIQFKLSKQKSKWPGLILPFIFFILATFFVLVTIYNGDIITLILTFIVYLIPTIIHLLIYGVVRSNNRDKNKQEIDKMRIQDL